MQKTDYINNLGARCDVQLSGGDGYHRKGGNVRRL